MKLEYLYLPCLLYVLLNLTPQAGYCQMIVGHRGASYDAPENTLAAFREAAEQGADGIEGDFYLTQDKQIVCIHDKDTERTAGTKLIVADSTLAELRELEYGSWKAAKFRGEPIPTLADILKWLPADMLFVIELKVGPEIVPALKQQLEEFEVNQKRLLIISFNAETVTAAKQQLPNVRAHWLTSYKRNKQSGAVSPTRREIAETLKQSRADGLGTQGDRSVVTQEFIAELRAGGMREFHVWTVDQPEDAAYFQELGAVGITTNRPRTIRESLRRELKP
ncbi:MAG: glycerophosphodiester phosphodiesterase [Pirellulaceae bacterium]